MNDEKSNTEFNNNNINNEEENIDEENNTSENDDNKEDMINNYNNNEEEEDEEDVAGPSVLGVEENADSRFIDYSLATPWEELVADIERGECLVDHHHHVVVVVN